MTPPIELCIMAVFGALGVYVGVELGKLFIR